MSNSGRDPTHDCPRPAKKKHDAPGKILGHDPGIIVSSTIAGGGAGDWVTCQNSYIAAAVAHHAFRSHAAGELHKFAFLQRGGGLGGREPPSRLFSGAVAVVIQAAGAFRVVIAWFRRSPALF